MPAVPFDIPLDTEPLEHVLTDLVRRVDAGEFDDGKIETRNSIAEDYFVADIVADQVVRAADAAAATNMTRPQFLDRIRPFVVGRKVTPQTGRDGWFGLGDVEALRLPLEMQVRLEFIRALQRHEVQIGQRVDRELVGRAFKVSTTVAGRVGHYCKPRDQSTSTTASGRYSRYP